MVDKDPSEYEANVDEGCSNARKRTWDKQPAAESLPKLLAAGDACTARAACPVTVRAANTCARYPKGLSETFAILGRPHVIRAAKKLNSGQKIKATYQA